MAYVGIYYWDSGTQVLQLFKRSGSSWEQLGGTYDSGALSAGIDLELAAVGSAITLSENGAVVISATDDSLADGTPGIMADGTASAGDWAGADVVQGVLLWYHHDQLGSTRALTTYAGTVAGTWPSSTRQARPSQPTSWWWQSPAPLRTCTRQKRSPP